MSGSDGTSEVWVLGLEIPCLEVPSNPAAKEVRENALVEAHNLSTKCTCQSVFRKSTPPQNRQLDVLVSNSK